MNEGMKDTQPLTETPIAAMEKEMKGIMNEE